MHGIMCASDNVLVQRTAVDEETLAVATRVKKVADIKGTGRIKSAFLPSSPATLYNTINDMLKLITLKTSDPRLLPPISSNASTKDTWCFTSVCEEYVPNWPLVVNQESSQIFLCHLSN